MFRIVTKKRRNSFKNQSKRVSFLVNAPVYKEYIDIDLTKNAKQRISHKFGIADERIPRQEKFATQQSAVHNWQDTLYRYINAKEKIQGRKEFSRQFQLHPLNKVNKMREIKLMKQSSLPHSLTLNASNVSQLSDTKQMRTEALLLKQSVKLHGALVRSLTDDNQSQFRGIAENRLGAINIKKIELVSFKEEKERQLSRFMDNYLKKKEVQKNNRELNVATLKISNIRRSNIST